MGPVPWWLQRVEEGAQVQWPGRDWDEGGTRHLAPKVKAREGLGRGLSPRWEGNRMVGVQRGLREGEGLDRGTQPVMD